MDTIDLSDAPRVRMEQTAYHSQAEAEARRMDSALEATRRSAATRKAQAGEIPEDAELPSWSQRALWLGGGAVATAVTMGGPGLPVGADWRPSIAGFLLGGATCVLLDATVWAMCASVRAMRPAAPRLLLPAAVGVAAALGAGLLRAWAGDEGARMAGVATAACLGGVALVIVATYRSVLADRFAHRTQVHLHKRLQLEHAQADAEVERFRGGGRTVVVDGGSRQARAIDPAQSKPNGAGIGSAFSQSGTGSGPASPHNGKVPM